jgi:hypothetical protein
VAVFCPRTLAVRRSGRRNPVLPGYEQRIWRRRLSEIVRRCPKCGRHIGHPAVLRKHVRVCKVASVIVQGVMPCQQYFGPKVPVRSSGATREEEERLIAEAVARGMVKRGDPSPSAVVDFRSRPPISSGYMKVMP